MPYIKPASRTKFESVIKDVTNLVTSANVPQTSKAEYFGYFVHLLSRRYIQTTDSGFQGVFNNYLFPDATRKQIAEISNKIATLIGGGDPVEAAADLNYVITAIFWNLIEGSSYGFRTYLSGSIRHSLDLLTKSALQHADQKDRVMSSRRYVVTLGVLNDVLDETYRRKTTEFEEDETAIKKL